MAAVLNGLATILGQRGEPVRAVIRYQQALAIKERMLGPRHPEVGVLLNNLAVAHRQSGDVPAAMECYRRALPVLSLSLAPSTPRLRLAQRTSAV